MRVGLACQGPGSCSRRARVAGGMCTEPHQAHGLRGTGCCGAAAAWACASCAPPVDGRKRRAHACKSRVGGQDHPWVVMGRHPPPGSDLPLLLF